eukprot:SAG11_NODE_786_length_7172_cov_3.635939_1_plen_74_part_00
MIYEILEVKHVRDMHPISVYIINDIARPQTAAGHYYQFTIYYDIEDINIRRPRSTQGADPSQGHRLDCAPDHG